MSSQFSFFDEDDLEISESNKISFGEIQIGTVSTTIQVWIWNDRGGLLLADTALTPHVFAIKSGDDDLDLLFSGSVTNKFNSMLEARSCGSRNTPSDMQDNWTPIGPMSYLVIGSMPLNSARLIELRINAPYDAQLFDLSLFTLRIHG